MVDMTFVNNRQNREFKTARLAKMGKSGVEYHEFTYKTMQNRQYLTSTSMMPLEFIKPTEIIRTSRADLPFAKGDVVHLYDGRQMAVKDVAYDEDERRALFEMDTRIAAILTLEGGAK